MSSKTYFKKRRQLLSHAARLKAAFKSGNKTLIDRLSRQLNMLISELWAVMSLAELRRLLASAGLVLILGAATNDIQAQTFAPSVLNPFGLDGVYNGAWIDLGDIDGDGDLDAIVGGYGEDDPLIFYFENQGDAANPEFTGPEANFGGITIDFDGFVMPKFVDIDDDGDLDIMASVEDNLLFFENIGTETEAEFADVEVNPFGIQVRPYMFSPTFADLDDDGDLDLLVGSYYEDDTTYDAPLFYYENIGSAEAASFDTPVVNPFGATPAYYFAFPTLADVDEDGDLDLLVGEAYDYFSGTRESDLLYFENIGTAESPEFGEVQRNPFALRGGEYISYPVFADIDDDGDLDLFYGEAGEYYDEYGNIRFFENLGASSVNITDDPERFNVFPNPAADVVHAHLAFDIDIIEIIDAKGVKTAIPYSGGPIDISSIPPGLIMIRAIDAKGQVFQRKVVVFR